MTPAQRRLAEEGIAAKTPTLPSPTQGLDFADALSEWSGDDNQDDQAPAPQPSARTSTKREAKPTGPVPGTPEHLAQVEASPARAHDVLSAALLMLRHRVKAIVGEVIPALDKLGESSQPHVNCRAVAVTAISRLETLVTDFDELTRRLRPHIKTDATLAVELVAQAVQELELMTK